MSLRNIIVCLIIVRFVWASQACSGAIVEHDFSEGFGLWGALPDQGRWELSVDPKGDVRAHLAETGSQRPPVRRPQAYRLLTGQLWGDVTFGLRARTLEQASRYHRDIVLIFGYLNDTHFYYTHLSSDSDGRVHTVIMKVHGEARSVIMDQPRPPAPLTGDWQSFRVEREVAGAIRVYVDDAAAPLMTAHDTDYPAGLVGFGAFDDRALFDDLRVEGERLGCPSIEPLVEPARLTLRAPILPYLDYAWEQSADGRTWETAATGIDVSQGFAKLETAYKPTALFYRLHLQLPWPGE